MAKPSARKPAAGRARTGAATAARVKEFEAIQKKAKTVAGRSPGTHFDSQGNATGEWAAVLAELDAWAKKYKVRFRTTDHVPGGGDPGATPRAADCPRTFSQTDRTDWVGGGHITIKTTCNLRRQSRLTGRCIYSCVGEILGFSTH